MKIFNTKWRELQEFKPLSSREVKVYSCWPTVYNYAHIWNLRAYVFEDVVVRTLKFLWHNVNYVMNITDVEDKTIRASIEAWEDLKSYTEKYTKYFLEDLEKLHILLPDSVVPITSVIPEMVRMINTMLKRKNAYLWDDGSIYFDIKTFKSYWKFANLDMWNLKDWARVNSDEYDKDSASDFVLWKAWKESDKDNFWEEEFEVDWKKVLLKWRPGWHIECSACNMKYFGQQIDIHMWWIDLIFPHHQNEIAQTEACTRKEFSKYWLHSGHLMVDWKKMAKSAGNFYTLKDLEERYKNIKPSVLYRAIRLSYMNAKYSSELDFTFEKVDSNISVINSIDETLKLIDREAKRTENLRMVSREFSDSMQEYIYEYIEALEDNFNTPEAIAVFHDFLAFVNKSIREESFSLWELSSILDMFRTFNTVLAIVDFDILGDIDIPENIQKMFEERNNAKREKDFEKADKIRDELLKEWYKIIDDRSGSYLERM